MFLVHSADFLRESCLLSDPLRKIAGFCNSFRDGFYASLLRPESAKKGFETSNRRMLFQIENPRDSLSSQAAVKSTF